MLDLTYSKVNGHSIEDWSKFYLQHADRINSTVLKYRLVSSTPLFGQASAPLRGESIEFDSTSEYQPSFTGSVNSTESSYPVFSRKPLPGRRSNCRISPAPSLRGPIPPTDVIKFKNGNMFTDADKKYFKVCRFICSFYLNF